MTTKAVIKKNGVDYYTIRSRFIFNEIMQDKDICIGFLRLVFPELNIRDISINTEYTMENRLGKKGIRLDVYVEQTGMARVIDMEMQVAESVAELPKRARYYLSTIDGWMLKQGKRYRELYSTIVLFVCPFDPFGYGQKVYTFENICRENNTILLDVGQQIKFLNSTGVNGEVSKELQAVLDYISSDDGETDDAFAERLKGKVAEINEDAERRGVVMTFEEQEYFWKLDAEAREAVIEEQKVQLKEKDKQLNEKDMQLNEMDTQLKDKDALLKDKDAIIENLVRQLEMKGKT